MKCSLSKAIESVKEAATTYRGNTSTFNEATFDLITWSGAPPTWQEVLDYEQAIPVPKVIPRIVTSFQAKVALHEAGILEAAQAAILASNDTKTRLAWENGSFYRDSEFISSVGSTLGLSSVQIDDLFIVASKIK